MTLTDMDYIRAALASALAEGFTLEAVYRCAEHAGTPRDFDMAVNTLTLADQASRSGYVWVGDEWVEIT